MSKEKIEFCERCSIEREYEIIENIEFEVEYENKIVKYRGKKAICKHCKEELFVEEVEEFNQKAFIDAYNKQFDIISINEINEILKKYDIGKRPLSMLLGWGEVTISRYYNNSVPSIKNSKILKSILNDPKEYFDYLIVNKEKISKVAYKKSKNKVDCLLGIDEDTVSLHDENIINVTKYIIKNADVTHMGLQKMLYYIQVIYSSFFKKSVFISKCSAWEHGPVFGKIYYEYKAYKNNQIMICDIDEIILEENLKRVVDNVIKYFGCYGGKTLEYFTHNEDPWINAINKKNKTIEKTSLRKFGERIIKEYNINTIEEIYKYSSAMFNKYYENIKNAQ